MNEDGFSIEQSTDGATFGEVGRVEAGAHGAVISNLTPGTTYWFRVKAFNTAGFSPYSNTATATTMPGQPPSQGGGSLPIVLGIGALAGLALIGVVSRKDKNEGR